MNPTASSLEAADTGALRRNLGAFATGVAVLAVGGEAPHGTTVNSFTSVSLRPPLVLVCVDRRAVMHRMLTAGHFGISVLAADQEGLARYFADVARPLGIAQFDGVDHRRGPLTGVPLLNGALAGFECELWRTYDGGDHTIFVGRLLAAERPPATGADPLVFHDGGYVRVAAAPDMSK
ncbi:flavin reductase family protein [Nonomuraea sp. NPDC055795]